MIETTVDENGIEWIELDGIEAPEYPLLERIAGAAFGSWGGTPVTHGTVYQCKPCQIEACEDICFSCGRDMTALYVYVPPANYDETEYWE